MATVKVSTLATGVVHLRVLWRGESWVSVPLRAADAERIAAELRAAAEAIR